MKKCLSNLLIIVLTLFVACSEDPKEIELSPEEIELSPEEIENQKFEAIIEVHELIDPIADKALKSENPREELQKVAETYKNNPEIEKIEFDEDKLSLKYKNGGWVFWLLTDQVDQNDVPDVSTLKIDESLTLRSNSQDSYPKILFICQLTLEPEMADFVETIKKQVNHWKSLGYNVTTIYGDEFDTDFLSEGMKGYDAVFMFTHGIFCQLSGLTWHLTGQKTPDWSQFRIIFYKLWTKQFISLEMSNDYIYFSEKYIDDNYSKGDFSDNSIFYSGACQTMKDSQKRFAKVLQSKGISKIIGYDDDTKNYISFYNAKHILEGLLEGIKLNPIYESLTDNVRFDQNSNRKSYSTTDEIKYGAKKQSTYFYGETTVGMETNLVIYPAETDFRFDIPTYFNTDISYGTMIDKQGNEYKTVQIGNQVWMAENLRYLPSVVGPTTSSLTEPYYYVYDYNGTNVTEAKANSNYIKNGVLYNWQAAMNGEAGSSSTPSGVQGACPDGWHVPSMSEWAQLFLHLGETYTSIFEDDERNAGGKLKAKGTLEDGTGLWHSPNTGATNESGFTALPGGGFSYGGELFHGIGEQGTWWTTDADPDPNDIYGFQLELFHYSSRIGIWDPSKKSANSVRCVRDETPNPNNYWLNIQLSHSNGGTVGGAGHYKEGAFVAIPVTENSGYKFTGWSGDTDVIIHINNSIEDRFACITMPAHDVNLTANFEPINSDTGTFTDWRDNSEYKYITIGNQVWMSENLKYLPTVTIPQIISDTIPFYYVYGYEGTNVEAAKATENYQIYGVLYNWHAAMNREKESSYNPSGVQGACPEGWHLPSDSEWTQLETFLSNNGYNYDGSNGGIREKIALSMASESGWLKTPNISSNVGEVGSDFCPEYKNKSGFTGLPGGFVSTTGRFRYMSYTGRWWSTTKDANSWYDKIWFRVLYNDQTYVTRYASNKEMGMSIRCVKD
ncbi:MAG: hypothetical protein M0Q12_05350 [Synergistaceae bacterium]|jgi:uncharacterized protein (TIGR02145 family)/uncharacterized repeat protein (TIGR02543 family)|nr:hypothetical protein [Synergistaceae bacterium]